MKKIAYILGAVVLAAGSVSAVSSFADAAAQSSLAGSLVGQAKATGNTDAGKSDNQVETDVASSITPLIQQAINAGVSNADIQAAVTQAANDPSLTKAEAAGIEAVNAELSSLEGNKPGGVSSGTGGGGGAAAIPTPPPPAAAGSGYVG